MARNKLVHSYSGMEVIRRLAREGIRIFTTAQARALAPDSGVSEGYLRQALHHLARAGWIVRLRKGLYALSSSVPGVSSAHEFEVAMALVDPAAVSHWSASHYHNLTEQAPRKVFVLTTTRASVPRVRGAKAAKKMEGYPVGMAEYQFIQVKPEKFFGVQKVWVDEARVTITDPERTLLDGLSMPQNFGDFAEVLHAFKVRGEALDVERIIEYAVKLNAATAKRLGWVLERQGVELDRLGALVNVEIKGYRNLDASGPRKGSCNRRWMIQENFPGKIL